MSFADYTSLKSAVASDWMHRADLTTAIGDYIALFESDFNSQMRVRQMETETSQVSTAGYLTHPTSWLEWKNIRGTQGGVQYSLEPVTDEVGVAITGGDSTPARYYKTTGSRTYLYPSASGVTYPCIYFAGVALTSGTNWLLTAYPGAYLYGTLLQAVAAGMDDARVGLWATAYEAILERIRKDSRRGSFGGQALRMQLDSRVV